MAAASEAFVLTDLVELMALLQRVSDEREAPMYAGVTGPSDRERARPLVDAALLQFRTLGMPGWIRRGEALLETGAV